MSMVLLLSLFFACEKGLNWNDTLESKICRANPSCAKKKEGLLLHECIEQQSRTNPPKPKERDSILHFCDALRKADDSTTVACGLAACVDLAVLDPQAGLQRLTETSKSNAMKKNQQKSLIFGFMHNEQRFISALKASVEANRTNWVGLAIAEADCGLTSTSKQLNVPCPKPMIDAASFALELGKKDSTPLVEVLTAFNLALALNPSLDLEMAEMATQATSDTPQALAAAQALRVQFARDPTRNPTVKDLLKAACKQPTRRLMGLCE